MGGLCDHDGIEAAPRQTRCCGSCKRCNYAQTSPASMAHRCRELQRQPPWSFRLRRCTTLSGIRGVLTTVRHAPSPLLLTSFKLTEYWALSMSVRCVSALL